MKNEEILEDFMNHSHQMSGYWIDVKLKEVQRGKHLILNAAETKLLKELVSTDAGKEALRMLLLDYSRSNLFSTLEYIDGATGVKPVELINAKTGEPLADGHTHEYLSLFDPSTTTSKLVI